LRLGLAQLEHEGLLESVPGGGFVVRSFTREEIMDAIELRGVLEGTAARFAAERLTHPRELEAMHGCVAQLEAIVRPDRPEVEAFERYVELNERFHELLAEASRSRVLQTELERLHAQPFASPSAFVHLQTVLPESHRILYLAQVQHRGIVEAIEAREGARAEALAREHARTARRNLDLAFSSEHVLSQLPGATLIRFPEVG
jgi:GntR family transcriptional regulator of vanillate catabolism